MTQRLEGSEGWRGRKVGGVGRPPFYFSSPSWSCFFLFLLPPTHPQYWALCKNPLLYATAKPQSGDSLQYSFPISLAFVVNLARSSFRKIPCLPPSITGPDKQPKQLICYICVYTMYTMIVSWLGGGGVAAQIVGTVSRDFRPLLFGSKDSTVRGPHIDRLRRFRYFFIFASYC